MVEKGRGDGSVCKLVAVDGQHRDVREVVHEFPEENKLAP